MVVVLEPDVEVVELAAVVVVLPDGSVEGINGIVVVVVDDALNIEEMVVLDGNLGVTPLGSKANVTYMNWETTMLEALVVYVGLVVVLRQYTISGNAFWWAYFVPAAQVAPDLNVNAFVKTPVLFGISINLEFTTIP